MDTILMKAPTDIFYENLRNVQKVICSQPPTIVDISIGDDFGGKKYAEMKKKKLSSELGMVVIPLNLPQDSTVFYVRELIQNLNDLSTVNGIMVQLPLPDNLKNCQEQILSAISHRKDIDGLTDTTAGNLFKKNTSAYVPCTAKGIIALLKSYGISLEGKRVAILNRSNIVGKPLAALCLQENATPIICHSKTQNLKDITSHCDIVVAAVNKPHFLTADYIASGAVVVDVGVHSDETGRIIGDVDFEDCIGKASFLTPPIGSVGAMTVCMLGYNSIDPTDRSHVLQQSIAQARERFLSYGA